MNKIEKIAVNGHYVWVDKDAEIKKGDMCVNIAHNVIVKPTDLEWANSNSDNLKVIVTASPELNLEDVPTYVEWLAKEWMSMWVVGHGWMWENVNVDTNDQTKWKGYYTEEQLYELYLKENNE